MPSPPPLSSNTRGLQVLESIWIGFFFTAIVVAARIYTRARMVRKVNWDDYLMLAAFLVNLVSYVLTTLAVMSGFGQHTSDLVKADPHLVIEAMKWAQLGQVFGISASALARMAFVAMLISIISPTQRLHVWLLRAFFFVQAVINGIVVLYILLQCRPISGLWNPASGAKCLPPSGEQHLGYGQATINSFTDLSLAIFPTTVIWKLNMKRSLKLSLCVTMGLGAFALITSIIKAVNLTDISANPIDLTYAMFGLQFWMGIEVATLIVAASIPALRPLFSRRRTTTQASSYGASNHGLNKHSYQSRKRTWNESKATNGGSSVDQIELTSSDGHIFGMGSDTECIVGGEEQPVGVSQPEGTIMKTMSTKVAF